MKLAGPSPVSLRNSLRRARASGLRARVRGGDRRVGLVLVYHLLDDHTGDHERELVAPHSAELFRRHLEILARHFDCVRAAEFGHAVATRTRGRRPPVAITFDDDSASHVELALPALAAAGVPATFFLTGAGLPPRSTYWWEDLEAIWRTRGGAAAPELCARLGVPPPDPGPRSLKEVAAAVEALPTSDHDAARRVLRDEAAQTPGGLTSIEIRALVRAGHEIGFHTRKHYRLPLLDDGLLAAAMQDGRAELEELAGGALRTLAYPHGRADARVATAARSAGFGAAFTTDANRHTAGDDPLRVGRYWPTYGPAEHFEVEVAQLLAGRWGNVDP